LIDQSEQNYLIDWSGWNYLIVSKDRRHSFDSIDSMELIDPMELSDLIGQNETGAQENVEKKSQLSNMAEPVKMFLLVFQGNKNVMYSR